MVCQGHLFTTQRDYPLPLLHKCNDLLLESGIREAQRPAVAIEAHSLFLTWSLDLSKGGSKSLAVCTCTTRWFDTSRGARAARLYTIGCPEDKETRHARAGHMFRCGPENNEYAGCYDALCNQAFRGFLSEA